MRSSFLLTLVSTALLGQQSTSTPVDRAPAIIQLQGGGALGWLQRPYQPKSASQLDLRNTNRIYDLLKAGNLYLSLAETIALAVENNLDVEISRFQIPIAASDVDRAKAGAGLRGISLTTSELPVGVGGPASPLLNIPASAATPSTAVSGDIANLSVLRTNPVVSSVLPGSTGSPGDFSGGPAIPLYDPTLSGALYRTHSTIPDPLSSPTSVITTNSTVGSLAFQQGYSLGGTYALSFNTLLQNITSPPRPYNPYSSGALELTITQPLLRGFGTAVNRRFITIGKNDQKISDLSFRQQLINTVFGISRLYYDLVALSEDLEVKRETLRAANTLYENTKAGVEEGTLAPVELTRAEAQVAGAEQDLVNSQGLFDEQEVIVKNLLSRRGTEEPGIQTAHIVTTDALTVPQQETFPVLNDLMSEATQQRPDLLQAGLQITNSEIQLKATRNALLPQLDLVGIAANNGLTADSGLMGTNPGLIGGYNNLLGQLFSQKYPTYSVGIQLNLPIRNRIAQADLVRDEFSIREVQARRQQLRNQARLEVEDALVGLRRSRSAYDAAVRTRLLQERSLDVEHARFEAGVDTAFFVIQYQSYLAQARSTEVVAKSNYFKAKAALDRAIGASLTTNSISVDEAYHGRIARQAAPTP